MPLSLEYQHTFEQRELRWGKCVHAAILEQMFGGAHTHRAHFDGRGYTCELPGPMDILEYVETMEIGKDETRIRVTLYYSSAPLDPYFFEGTVTVPGQPPEKQDIHDRKEAERRVNRETLVRRGLFMTVILSTTLIAGIKYPEKSPEAIDKNVQPDPASLVIRGESEPTKPWRTSAQPSPGPEPAPHRTESWPQYRQENR